MYVVVVLGGRGRDRPQGRPDAPEPFGAKSAEGLDGSMIDVCPGGAPHGSAGNGSWARASAGGRIPLDEAQNSARSGLPLPQLERAEKYGR